MRTLYTASPALAVLVAAPKRSTLVRNCIAFASVLAGALALSGSRAEANVIIDITQVGSNVVATGSGTINLTGLTFVGNIFVGSGIIQPSSDAIIEGPPSSTLHYDDYSVISGPLSFGSGGPTFASSGSGDIFGVLSPGNLAVPLGYTSGSLLSGTDTYSGQTFSSLGLTPGTYKWTWGTGVNADSLTVDIIAPSSVVPEPCTLTLAGIAAASGLGYFGWRRRKLAVA